MESTQALNHVQFCKDILLEEYRYNAENNIWPSVNVMIVRLLNQPNLNGFYEELQYKLGNVPNGVSTFFDIILSIAAFWQPKAISNQRDSKRQLNELKSQIAETAEKLADLIQKREIISNDSGFSANSHYHIVDVIEEAGSSEHLYRSWVSKKLQALANDFGLKYWPSITDIVSVLATDARRAEVEAHDNITNAATEAIRPSKSDFVNALYVALGERSQSQPDTIPDNFKLSDGSMASLVNCLLDLEPDDLIDNVYIKGFRQRKRRLKLPQQCLGHSDLNCT